MKSKPKKQKNNTSKHDPKTKSLSYPNTKLESINETSLRSIIKLLEIDAEIPKILTYEVEYLDDE